MRGSLLLTHQIVEKNVKTMSKLLFALMLAAGATSLAVGVQAEEKKKVSPGSSTAEINRADCTPAGPGDKSKKREKVAPGTAQPGGEIAPEDCKAKPAGKSDKSRAQVKQDAKAANKAGEIPYGEADKKK